jgi:hypothetical protein
LLKLADLQSIKGTSVSHTLDMAIYEQISSKKIAIVIHCTRHTTAHLV